MEVDSGNIEKKVENFSRNLRNRNKHFIDEKAVKHRTRKIKIFSSRKSIRRYKSLEPLKKHNSLKKAQTSLTSKSSTSLDSVIYLGFYRKIPQLITLDESNDSVKNPNENKLHPPITEETTSERIDNISSSNDTQSTNFLLELVNDMCVDTTNKRTKRTRIRRGKN